ncbi:glycosyltransferase family 4 protein [Aquihabitans sp. McL0605]|uniref:glycosyltransferase family 4 protein n=1 Tax=Aquihabitans sp. McL0605 TaxID=3415671 RepID=UPI003CE67053
MTATPPTLGFLGIHADGRPGQALSQDEVLAGLFAAEGYRVRRASSVKWAPLRTAHQIWELLRWRDVDVLVIAVFSGPSFAMAEIGSFLGRRIGRRKVVLFLHGGNLPAFAPAHEQRVRRAFDRADLILAPSSFLADAFRPWGYDVRVVPNVLPFDPPAASVRGAARPALLWMRTFHEHYDPLAAVECMRLVAQAHPDATMTMAGADHGLLAAVKERARELGVDDRITFPGYLDARGKAAAFADHDIFLNTNRVDNTPVSLLEAAANGLVPVAVSVGGIPALLTDDVDAVLVAPDDLPALAGAVTGLIDSPARFERLSAGARARAEASMWPAVQARWVEELRLLVPGGYRA